jgi:hypothetical protein
MSKHNKVNKTNYDQAGRLTPDDLARERKKMMPADTPDRDRVRGRGFEPRHPPAGQMAPDEPEKSGEPESSQDPGEREESK